MPVIYFDNFRGFNSTFLPLKDVNFFVGENSTGKTSILKLIGILSSQEFWRYGQFGRNETSLGGFSEIITSNSNNKLFFEIGFLEDSFKGRDHFIKLKFIEKKSENYENYPALKEICYQDETINIQVIVEGAILKYRFILQSTDSEFSNEIDDFKLWIKNQGLDTKPFLRTDMEYSNISDILYQLKKLITENLFSQDTGKGRIRLSPQLSLNSLAWMAPIRAEPQKTYQYEGLVFNSEGKHAPSVLRDILHGQNVKKILKRFGTDSGLFEDIDIKNLSQGNNEINSFEILVSINGAPRNITNVGYGVSQVLPIIVEVIARPNYSWFALQQPELHLHPKAQAALGDFIFKSNIEEGQKFIIETHSDYTIDRFRLRINRALNDKKAQCIGQIIFFTNKENGNNLELISIEKNGSYQEVLPKAFKEFFINEQLNLLSL